MPMFTVHAEDPTPTISGYGEYVTVRWDTSLTIQLNAAEWIALVDAIAAHAPALQEVIAARSLHRDENEIRSAAEIREGL